MGRKSGKVQSYYIILAACLLSLCILALRTWEAKPSGSNILIQGDPLAGERRGAAAPLGPRVAAEDALPADKRDKHADAGVHDTSDEHFHDEATTQPSNSVVVEATLPQPIELDLLVAHSSPPVRAHVRPPLAEEVTEPTLPDPPLELVPDLPGVESLRIAWRHPETDPVPPSVEYRGGELARRIGQSVALRSGCWPRAARLHEQLIELENSPAAAWAAEVRSALEHLEQIERFSSPQARGILGKLAELATRPLPSVETYPLQTDNWLRLLARARYGLARRVELWQQIERSVQEEPSLRVHFSSVSIADQLAQISSVLPSHGRAGEWRRYLLLDQLSLVAGSPQVDMVTRQTIAQRVLSRLTSDRLNEEQRRFVAQPALARLNEQLRHWAYIPPNYAEFLEAIEAWEQLDARAAEQLVAQWHYMKWSPFEEATAVARIFDTHYRNANIRVAISSELLNRFLPPVYTTEEEVNDEILGTPVSGRSRIVTRLFVELIPDRMRWRLGVEARGQVQSQTWAERGSVTLFTHGATRYRARKLLTIDRHGIFAHRTETEAQNDSELAEVTTRLDGLPLLGSLLRSLARRTHTERLPEANAEVEQKVSHRVAERLDAEVTRRIYEWEKRYRERLVAPLVKLDLPLTTLDMHTTSKRLIARYRLAGDNQLASCTPRPIAPADSLLSLQIHESAVNNVLERLRLSGRRVSLSDLYRQITEAFGKKVEPPEDVPDQIVVTFADQDPIRVRFDQGRVELLMKIAELRSGRDRWYEFEVYTWFTPQVVDRKIVLVRDGVIELRGAMSFADRLPLRAIFTAILARERTIPLLDPRITEDPRLADTHVSQLVAVDGWIGLAISPLPKVARPQGPVHVSLSDQNLD